MISKYNVGEYPEMGYGFYETDIIIWLAKKSEFTILRYKYFDDNFKKQFLKNILKTKNKFYKITHKTDNTRFYCSQYIWYLFWKTAKDLSYSLDIDTDDGYLVTPYNLMNSEYFSIVKF